ncbi:hypothetical protein ES703_33198 [subsurface metagenome]
MWDLRVIQYWQTICSGEQNCDDCIHRVECKFMVSFFEKLEKLVDEITNKK